MGLIQAFKGALEGTLADQWKDVITADYFDEYSVVVPGVYKQQNNGRGVNDNGSDGIITNGSKIFVPENAVAFIFSQSGIEEIITESGGYTYSNGQDTIFDNTDSSLFNRFSKAIFNQTKERFTYGGQTAEYKQIAFVNLREIRGIKFGTKGPLMYHDIFYGADLAVQAFGSFSIKIVDPIKFIRQYVPAQSTAYSFNDPKVRSLILAEFLQSFINALNTLSTQYRISQLPSQANQITATIQNETLNAGTWNDRFGFEIVSVGIENIELSPDSQALVKKYTENKMNLKAYEDISQKASNIAAQQNISEGIKEHGFGDGGMLFGMNFANAINPMTAQNNQKTETTLTFDEQIAAVTKLKDLLDLGVLSEEEFNKKKKEIMGL
ncbi:MAG: SPFH domain-containing protein [Culicoidibacterales bacterium]